MYKRQTYNNLYLDTRKRLKAAGVEMAQLEARELVCFAADKTREQFFRDLTLYASKEVEDRVEELTRRRLSGEPAVSYTHLDVYKRQVEDGTGQHKLYDHIGQGDAVSADRIQKTSPAQCGKEFVQQGERGQIHPAKDDRVHQNAGPTDHEAAPAPESGGGVSGQN